MSPRPDDARRSGEPLDELLRMLIAVVPPPSVIHTLASHKPNWIVGIASEGVHVQTETSKEKGIDANSSRHG